MLNFLLIAMQAVVNIDLNLTYNKAPTENEISTFSNHHHFEWRAELLEKTLIGTFPSKFGVI